MNAVADYFAVIDAIAVLALIALAVAAIVRHGSIVMGVLTGVVAAWPAIRLFGII
jgi:hypothetical protein